MVLLLGYLKVNQVMDSRWVSSRVVTIAKGVILWLIVFISGLAVNLLVMILSGVIILSAIATQLIFITMSLIIAKITTGGNYTALLGFRRASPKFIFMILAISLPIATSLACAELLIVKGHGPQLPVQEIIENTILYVVLALVLAPLCEETLFRGLLLGYMLNSGVNPWLSIAISAVLFSFLHLIPFSAAPRLQQIFVVSAALVLSTIAGYARYRTHSLVPAMVAHATFNLGGMIASHVVTLALKY